MRRDVSLLIPYKKENGEILVFLERRSKTATRLADWFGFWGGGIESGETPDQTLTREMKEELNFEPVGYKHFKDFEFGVLKSAKYIYILEVDKTFETKIKYHEAQYGKWFNQQQIETEKLLIEDDKTVLREFFNSVTGENI
ncbi:MAG: NUDIX domain-containing protein [Candidatus Parcubacteria bacterium]|nr:NUDIX domain-containing protein [Candidatus Parcubacteria bacterium]